MKCQLNPSDWLNTMNPAEQIAEATWERIRQSREVKVRLGEETFTDLLVLDFIRQMGNRTRLFQSTRAQESKRGTDLEIRIHAGGNRAIALAVQAKRLHRSERYDGLNAKVKSGCPQIHVLERYARWVWASPYYLLYNYANLPDLRPYWHCCEPFDERQLGCTLVPSWNIRRAISSHGHRSFGSIHESCAALPWRCLFDCPKGRDHRLLPAARRSLSIFRESSTRSDDAQDEGYYWVDFEPIAGGWPEWLWTRDGSALSDEEVDRLRYEILRQKSGSEEAPGAATPDAPSEETPRRFLLVKDWTD